MAWVPHTVWKIFSISVVQVLYWNSWNSVLTITWFNCKWLQCDCNWLHSTAIESNETQYDEKATYFQHSPLNLHSTPEPLLTMNQQWPQQVQISTKLRRSSPTDRPCSFCSKLNEKNQSRHRERQNYLPRVDWNGKSLRNYVDVVRYVL